jgi:hypothetical protein
MRPLRRWLAVVLLVASVPVLATVLAGCAGRSRQRAVEGGPVETGPGTTKAARQYLEGRWALMSFEVTPPGREKIDVPGSGTLLYDAYGNLKIDIRVNEATSQALSNAGIPVQNGMLSMDGRTAIDMGRQTLTYVLEGQPPIGAPAGPLATNRPRYWQVEGNVLTLSTKDDQGNVLSVARWQKQP